MSIDHSLSSCRRGSSPSAPHTRGTDEWVSGIRSLIGTAEEWLASREQEAGTLPDRTTRIGQDAPSPTPQDPGSTRAVAA